MPSPRSAIFARSFFLYIVILEKHSHLEKTLETREETLTVALDISKAFDQIWHKNLLAKLPSRLFDYYIKNSN